MTRARSGNDATLLTLHIQSRHAAPATLIAFEAPTKYSGMHREHSRMCFSMRGGVAASVKRSCADDLLCICRRYTGHLAGFAVAAVKRGRTGDELHGAFSRPRIQLRQGVWLTAVLPLQLGAVHAAVVDCASKCASVGCAYGVRPCSRVWPCELRIDRRREEGHGSQW